jgi:tRNA (guanine26-N2/guanine27-N2)-dimethyltransferase
MAVLAGNTPEVCYAKYGALSLKAKYCHEAALRTVLQSLTAHAARYGRYIEPLLSCSLNFYIRMFVRVHDSKLQTKLAPTKLAMLLQAQGIDSFALQPFARTAKQNAHKVLPGQVRPEAEVADSGGDAVGKKRSRYEGAPGSEFYGYPHEIAGPIWAEPIHSPAFVTSVLQRVASEPDWSGEWPADGADGGRIPTKRRMHGILTAVAEELLDVPLYYSISSLSNTLHCTTPALPRFMSALQHAGYRVSGSHCNPMAVKTDAPPGVIWDIMRCHCKMHPVSAKRLKGRTAAARVLEREPTLKANFEVTQEVQSRALSNRTAGRFLPNPEPYWGPKARADGKRKAPEAMQRGPSGGQTKKTKKQKKKVA